MKKAIIAAMFLLSACGPSLEEMEARAKAEGPDIDIRERTIGGCEYIIYNGTLTHKANCINHKNNQ